MFSRSASESRVESRCGLDLGFGMRRDLQRSTKLQIAHVGGKSTRRIRSALPGCYKGSLTSRAAVIRVSK